MTPALVAVEAVVAGAFLVLAAFGVRERDRPGAGAAALLWLALAGVTAVVAAGRTGVLSRSEAAWAVIAGWVVSVPLWAGFAFSHTGRGVTVTRRWQVAAVAYVALVFATTRYAVVLGGPAGRLLQVATSILQTTLIGVGLYAVFVVARGALDGTLDRRRAVPLAVGGLGVAGLLFSMVTVNAVGPAPIPALTTGFLAVTAAGFAVSVLAYRLFDESPGTAPLARRTVFEKMGDAVVVLDRRQRLVDANETAESALGVSLARDAGRPAEDALGFDVAATAGGRATVSTPTGRRVFAVSESTLRTRRGDTVGASYLLRDVTDEQTREQRLEVFNRVLRHNLRNDLDAIRGFAEVLEDDVDASDLPGRIRSTADDLVDVGATVARANQLMTRDDLRIESVDARDLAEAVAADLRERYDCEVAVDADESASLRTDAAILRTALAEVVENAVEHADSDVPEVSVAVDSTDDGVRLSVRDDGPGIPDRERDILLDGEETPLQHGSGVGLWFVSWAVTRLGGTLSFADRDADAGGGDAEHAGDDEGADVHLVVPDRPADANAAT